jgi:hypothetical protein
MTCTDTGMGIPMGNRLQRKTHRGVPFAANHIGGTVIIIDNSATKAADNTGENILDGTIIQRHF